MKPKYLSFFFFFLSNVAGLTFTVNVDDLTMIEDTP